MGNRFEDEFAENPTQRIPICLCLDTSGSMKGKAIAELNEGVKLLYKAVKEDEVACYSAEICIVTFGSVEKPLVKCVADFSDLSKQTKIPTLVAGGETPLGDAVNLALDMLEERKNQYKQYGIEYYQPWLVIMTDGLPGADLVPHALATAQKRATELVKNKKLTVMPVWTGHENRPEGLEILNKFSPVNKACRLKDLDFKLFFTWLSSSISGISQSNSKAFKQLPVADWAIM